MAKKNDIYFGDLRLIKKRVSEWESLHAKHKQAMVVRYGIVLLGFAAILGAYFYDPVTASKHQISLFTGTIFFAFVAMILVSIKVNSVLQPPFTKLYNARFEASDEGIYCYYQQKMALYQYFIADQNIKEWVVDKDANCMYIGGTGEVTMTKKSGEVNLGDVSGFYMLIPFDNFDLDDLVRPYGELVKIENETLRDRFSKEGASTPYIK